MTLHLTKDKLSSTFPSTSFPTSKAHQIVPLVVQPLSTFSSTGDRGVLEDSLTMRGDLLGVSVDMVTWVAIVALALKAAAVGDMNDISVGDIMFVVFELMEDTRVWYCIAVELISIHRLLHRTFLAPLSLALTFQFTGLRLDPIPQHLHRGTHVGALQTVVERRPASVCAEVGVHDKCSLVCAGMLGGDHFKSDCT